MKTERFAVRLTAEQDALIRRAAAIEGTDLTNFTVTARARALASHVEGAFCAHFDVEPSPTDPLPSSARNCTPS